MTKLGLFLAQRSVNKSEAARKAGLSKARMNELTLNERSHLRAEELYLIALAIGVDPGDLLEYVCSELNADEQLPLAADEQAPYETEQTKKKRK